MAPGGHSSPLPGRRDRVPRAPPDIPPSAHGTGRGRGPPSRGCRGERRSHMVPHPCPWSPFRCARWSPFRLTQAPCDAVPEVEPYCPLVALTACTSATSRRRPEASRRKSPVRAIAPPPAACCAILRSRICSILLVCQRSRAFPTSTTRLDRAWPVRAHQIRSRHRARMSTSFRLARIALYSTTFRGVVPIQSLRCQCRATSPLFTSS